MVTEQAYVFPLSFGQQRLWFLHQLEPDLPLYNIPIARRLNGKLDIEALEQSFNGVIRHHEALRTTFQMVDERPAQVVHPTLIVKLPLIDLHRLPPREREAEIEKLMQQEAQLPFDLTRGPLIRAQVLQFGPEEHILLLTVHHIVFDDWSMGIFCRELQTLYNSYQAGISPSLSELPIQYADYAAWEREWQEKTFETQMVYWKQQLKDAPALLELPVDHPRPPIRTYRGETHPFILSGELSQALSMLSRREEATLFMTLLAAFQILLARYTQQDDSIVGSPIINRSRIETEGLIGFFVNTLVLRTNLTGNPSFRELLKRVRKVALDAYAHCDLPFEKLVDELQTQRDLRYSPLFQVMFALQNASSPDLELTGLHTSILKTTSGTAKSDLSLTIMTGKELIGIIEYSTDLFDKETIVRMAEHFRTLLEGIIADPDQRITDLPLVTARERWQLFVEWNETARNYPEYSCLHQLFERQVEQSPTAIALVCGTQRLTYQEVNERANQLAHYLQHLGVRPEVMVGICMQRSLEMVIGLLGILKAGGGYVPLDPAYPKERLAFILEDMQTPVLLTERQLEQELPAYRAQAIYLDTDWQIIAQHSKENLPNKATAQNTAYVIYTSGSTGKPKGVMIPQQALVNFLLSMSEHLNITEQDTMLATTSLSFDIAGLELYLPLLIGAQIVVASREMVSDGKQLIAAIDSSPNPILQMTPAAWRLLIETGWQGNQQLRMLCGGEALPLELARTLLAKGASLTNLYGPTETTIWSTLHPIEQSDISISLGQPIANTQLYVLDAAMQPVAVGIPGELYIGGAGLARGYLNRPDLTAERFVPHPYGEAPGARLYRTGDIVRYRSRHTIEFLGRIDQQVKVRGFRIEPGEIEIVLREHQNIRDAVVIAREDTPGDRRLVAYLVANQEHIPPVADLRSYLGGRLPEYLVPSLFVFLDAFPLTPNGKVARNRLPAPDHHQPESNRNYVAPRRPIEELLADIWEQVLGIEQVGVYDNLFDLGGDSLHSVQITARTQQVGLTIMPKQLFQYQTIDKLVNDLTAHQSSAEQIRKIEHFLQTYH